MNKAIAITNHKSLKRYMSALKSDMNKKEHSLKTGVKAVAFGLPSRIFHHKTSLERIMSRSNVASNPIGKLLSSVVKKTVLKNSGFLFKLAGGIFAKRAGRKIERKLLS
ncbi:hypothetical protein DHW03_01195 [Pedobacter yonginense]|uniref:Uncharacterized protein n=1 Tax=Pedobacter yonginense TaxID=651869 RepID=A0A317ERN4_9SPHI|nr:hypothetical protein [Pedobacter yonginense]PWS28503.1 hypothetical protein DHW03_01195 [Pedobacter yonginense]